jgi:hypothetical protein
MRDIDFYKHQISIFERIEKKPQIVTGKELAGFVSEPSLPSIPKPD